MTYRSSAIAALAFCLASVALERQSAAQAIGRMGQPGGPAGTAQIIPEELPHAQGSPGYHAEPMPPNGFVGQSVGPHGHAWGGGCPDEYSGGYYPQESGCCDSCGGSGYGCCDWAGICGASSPGCAPVGRMFFTADYLYVRANFSEAVSHMEREITGNPQSVSDRFEELDFEYESSYRFAGGWRLANCGEEIRLSYTRLTSFADSFVPDGSFLPFDPGALDDEVATIHSFVDVDSYDLEYRKTIPLGGPLGFGSGCGDACCGDAYCSDPCAGECGGGCPAWDITWSGGARYAEVDWNRSASIFDDGDALVRGTQSLLNFEGGGPRIGVEGRRYCGQDGWFSMYLKGDFSLLLGDFDLVTLQRDDMGAGAADDVINVQSIRGRHIVPVTELEAGLTANVTCNCAFTTGYLFSAWHDLGFRDEFAFDSAIAGSYDDANILGFDGYFARIELSY